MQGNQNLRLKNLLKILESENTGTWQKLYGYAIPVAGERLQEKITEMNRRVVAFIKEALNLWKIYEPGSSWMFHCQNESCLSHETNLAFPTMEKK